MGEEIDRLRFVQARDGEDAAREFARRGLVAYRKALKLKGLLNRRALGKSCLAFRHFLREKPTTGR